MNRNWRYSRSSVEGAQAKEFDDSGFERVVIPHTNVSLPWHSFDDKSYEFVSIYRRRFKLPAEARGQRVFVDFEGVMTASTVWINGVRLGEYKGGYTPFSFELTPHIDFDGENVLTVDVDSTERPDIPPFGNQIDYLTFGGIYREVSLRIVPSTFIENIFAKPRDVLTAHPALEVDCFLQLWSRPRTTHAGSRASRRRAASSRKRPSAFASGRCAVNRSRIPSTLEKLERHQAVGPGPPESISPSMCACMDGSRLVDQRYPHRRIPRGAIHRSWIRAERQSRQAARTRPPSDLSLCGPSHAGPRATPRCADPAQQICKCNIVRTSHYPQSRHFLDACDEFGLLVLEEIPGWQHIGDAAWKDIAVDNVRRMIRRDWNHPSIILWGVRINESHDDHDFYTRTNALGASARSHPPDWRYPLLPGVRISGRCLHHERFRLPAEAAQSSALSEHRIRRPYLSHQDHRQRRTPHRTHLRHARIHDQLASNPQYAGGIGWCAFDYNTHGDFGSGDRICYHGVTDIFREPKPAAGFYKSQCDPAEEVVLEPAFHWARGDESIGFTKAVVCSNCDHLKFYVAGKLVLEADPDRTQFAHLRYPPFVADIGDARWRSWGDLRIEGYIQGKQVIVKNYSGKGVDQNIPLLPDDTTLARGRRGHYSRRASRHRRIRRNSALRQRRHQIGTRRPSRNHRRQSLRTGRRHRSHLDSSQRAARNRALERNSSMAGNKTGGV